MKNIAWWILMCSIGCLVVYFTYTVGLSPFDEPNSKILPFLPGISLFAASHGFHESSLPNTGPIAFLIAAFNASFYMAIMFLVYRWTQRMNRSINRSNP